MIRNRSGPDGAAVLCEISFEARHCEESSTNVRGFARATHFFKKKMGNALSATAKTPHDDDCEARSTAFLIQGAGCLVHVQQACTLKPDEPFSAVKSVDRRSGSN